MKRQYLAIIYLLFLSIGTIFSLYIPKNEVTANDALIIPNDAIRLRILANSDSVQDQEIKRLVRDEVNKEITKWVSAIASKEKAKKIMQSGLPELQQIAEQVLEKENVNQTVKVEFGKVEFPTKLYGQFLYPAGEYEAILITLGEGVGANWWCVLFPPLCFLDFSNGVAVSEGFDEAEEKEAEEQREPVETVEESNEQETVAVSEEGFEEAEEKEAEEQKESVETIEESNEQETVAVSEGFEEAEEKEAEEQREPVETVEEGNEQETVAVSEGFEEVEEKEAEEQKESVEAVKESNKKQVANQKIEQPPVYIKEDEGPVEVKFFIKEIWDEIFG
ncbi:stage II sporulation protein R [Bacillus sp. V3B]|uniref:stage II sporulation protein R n=1 Tax=Bacillus sp. V3B TaxID=2804915 RepID=UPI00210E6551|nr:stage II sporulation protein R [Bacillus sp. V3B]MCQ6274602.1 stage II sporulation protein R [Bacillus sp. V3B]